MKKKKIAIITTGFKPVPAVSGGAIQVLNTYIIDENEIRKNLDIDLYTIYDSKIDKNKYKHTNIIMIKENALLKLLYKIINKFNSITFNFNFVFLDYPNRIRKKLKCKKYAKVIVENNMVVYRKICKKLYKNKIPLYFHLHNDLDDKEKSKKDAKLIAKTSEKVIHVSKFLSKSFENYTNTCNSCVLYNCIDFNKFNVELSRKDICKELNLNYNNTIYIYTGRIVKNKGVECLIDAFEQLQLKYKDINLIIIGFGSEGKGTAYEQRILKKIKNNNAILPLSFMKQDMLNKYIISSNVVVIPSLVNEGFGMVSLEAMALKKPIIATVSGGLVELLDNECSIMINKENIKQNLINAMEKTYKDKDFCNKIGEKAFVKVHSINEFNKDNYYNNFLLSIDEL